jgi:hypothetical protein
MHILFYLFIFPIVLFADKFSTHLSLQGFTGVINTPNAQVLKNGEAVLQYNNQFDNHLKNYNNEIAHQFEDNYIFGVGYISSLELIGRLADSKDYVRDISANIKYKLPLYHRYLPDIAIGIQDVGGDRTYFNNKYIVMDKKFWDTRFSLGYGKSGKTVVPAKMKKFFDSSYRMNGVFAGLEYKTTPWLSLLAEYDAKETHVGAKLTLPKKWIDSFFLSTIVKQNLTHPETAFAINLSIPLLKKSEVLYINSSYKSKDREKKYIIFDNNKNIKEIFIENQSFNKINSPQELHKKFISFGFENVSIGIQNSDTIYVACENTLFDQNDLDAIGYILGTIVNSNLKYKKYILTLLKNRLETITIIGNNKLLKKYIDNPNGKNSVNLKRDLKFTRNFDTSKVKFLIKNSNSSLLRPKIEIFPGLIAGVGTDVGVLDYSLSFYTNFYTTLYDGLMASVQYETILEQSDDFEDGRVFNKMYKQYMDNRFSTAMIHKTFHYNNILNTTSVGRFDRDYDGVLNLTNIVSDSGRHSVGLRLGSFKNKNKDLNDDKEVYLGTYRYFYTPLELFTEITYGKYWYKDNGGMFKVKRFFNDTAVSFYYQDTTMEKYIGFTITLPLTPRKLNKASNWGQVKGIRDFTTGLRSTVFRDDGTNLLNPFGGITPVSDFELGSYYLNSYRLTSEYIKKNISKLRNAYLLY